MIETEIKDGRVLELMADTVGELPDTSEIPDISDQIPEGKKKTSLKIRFILLTLGVSSLLPWNIILNAAGYFQIRLKGTRFEDNFSYFIQATAIFCNLFGSFSMLYLNKKFDTRKMALFTNITMCTPLILMTILAKTDTSTWQEEFFILNLAAFGVNAFSHGLCTSAQSALCTMISAEVMKDYYIGKGLAGLVASALTLITLSFPSLSAETATFYYFLVTTLLTLVGTTILTYYFINLPEVKEKTKEKKYAPDGSKENEMEKEEAIPLSVLLPKIKVQCITALLITITSLLIFPAIMTNLKPIHQPVPATDWTEKYFLPVTVYLIFALGDNVGKIASGFLTWPGKDTIVWVALIRSILVPLTFMTNIQPRTLPVWFKNDVVPSFLGFLTASTGGYLMNLVLAYAPSYVEGTQNKGRVSMIVFAFISLGLASGSAFIFAVPPLLNAY